VDRSFERLDAPTGMLPTFGRGGGTVENRTIVEKKVKGIGKYRRPPTIGRAGRNELRREVNQGERTKKWKGGKRAIGWFTIPGNKKRVMHFVN